MTRKGELDAFYFDKLPSRAKELFFEFLSDTDIDAETRVNFISSNGLIYDETESPIEVILKFAFDLEMYRRAYKPYCFYLISQVPIEVGDKKYRTDLYFSTEECESPYQIFGKTFNLCIECDGHEFHEKTKQQVIKRNTRDFDLKKAGYDVLHFSGSQIYSDPLKCAREIIDYIIANI